ncbi:hypothetical protein DKX38_020496 [Salix brachista]|uniref:Sialate O-acetylesterase domain-containing protein n=1 Tax=Salix brachista TaxID=2182728 RepID=A0A5N5K5G1_9ROSI|nr:hypothetical protein DKX38_020494 [Salix brachista]KAB5526648.1 hypothetical protein DKX38_020495 [Salix brachista]KAB5526649.1 hypothetical protein DKX38_020496 [Salix brachista]
MGRGTGATPCRHRCGKDLWDWPRHGICGWTQSQWLEKWCGGIRKWARGTQLYTQLVSRAGASVKEGVAIRAISWYQGESDTVTKEDADAYKGNMETLITNLHTDLNEPSLPVIQVALASGEGRFIEIVRRSQLAINLPNVKCIDANGLALQTDNLHLTTMSQVHLGLKLAGAFIDSFGHMP